MSSQETIRVLCTLPWPNLEVKSAVLKAAVRENFSELVFGIKDLHLLTSVLIDFIDGSQRESDVMRMVCDDFLLKQAEVIERQHKVVDEMRLMSAQLSSLLISKKEHEDIHPPTDKLSTSIHISPKRTVPSSVSISHQASVVAPHQQSLPQLASELISAPRNPSPIPRQQSLKLNLPQTPITETLRNLLEFTEKTGAGNRFRTRSPTRLSRSPGRLG
eukprot:TRINITY_DN8044_c0_g1_i1.p1 TRINITY_DN8044_c0_g1~~TRINITY_DN8044_c0_g1_i1.p1  ORF type:complete len:217 (+),score=23.54 TRINITY_DN8044_c0_g1_i1:62-712(+)